MNVPASFDCYMKSKQNPITAGPFCRSGYKRRNQKILSHLMNITL